MKRYKTNHEPKRGSIAEYKCERAFENRKISTFETVAEGLGFVALFIFFVILCAVA